jgi:16S rRNA (guanine527-N7)-methyltransferase
MKDILVNNSINVSEAVFNDLNAFCDFLLEKNKQFNLTAIRDKAEFFEKHLSDSLKGSSFFTEGKKILEVGSGGGFPSLPLKLNNRALDFTLLEATGKKCAFLNEVKNNFALDKLEIVNARAEEYSKTAARESFDIVTARAVASLNVLCELCLPFLKVGGKAVFYKQKSESEFAEGKKAIEILGGKWVDSFAYTLASSPDSERVIIIIEKVKNTPEKYPREYKKILKSPL